MPTRRVVLHAEQEHRSFTWLLSPDLAEELAERLREKGWVVTLRDEDPEGETVAED